MITRTGFVNWIHAPKFRRVILAAALFACLMDGFFYAGSLSGSLSHMGVYRQLKLDMPRSQAIQILSSHQISCGSDYPRETPPLACDFWDFWRYYRISFSPGADGQLEMKFFQFRPATSSLSSIVRRVGNRG